LKWLELEVIVDNEAVEPVSALFARFGYNEGVYVQEHVESKGEEGEYTVDLNKPSIVRTYIPAGEAAKEIVEIIERELYYLNMIRPVGEMHVRERSDEEWVDAWKEFFPVLHVGRRLVIKPSWLEYEPKEGEAVIEIDPGMAFGTGLHPSTRLVLEFMEEYVKPGDAVADIGTGSGILSLAAAKLGACMVWAVDNDPVAAQVATKNVESNALEDVIVVKEGSSDTVLADKERQASMPLFDVVLANIVARVIIDLSSDFRTLLRPGGHLLAAGIIIDRRDDVVKDLEDNGFQVVREQHEGDWVAIVGQKK
jgi:ribosomal protein L11 methyltransferase